MSTTTITRLHTIAPQFVVSDVAAAAKYYRDVLGFTVDSVLGDPPVFAMIRRDDVEIQLGKADGSRITPNHAVRKIGFDAYVRATDVEALASELRSRGSKIVEGPLVRGYGMRELVVEDESGYRLVFGEPA